MRVHIAFGNLIRSGGGTEWVCVLKLGESGIGDDSKTDHAQEFKAWEVRLLPNFRTNEEQHGVIAPFHLWVFFFPLSLRNNMNRT